jgi:hypothetical protein
MSQKKIAARNAMHQAKAKAKEVYIERRKQIENDFNKSCRPINDKFSEAKKKLEVEYHLKLVPLKTKHLNDLLPLQIKRAEQNESAKSNWMAEVAKINSQYRHDRKE